jgi:hypothetical protein
MQPVVDESAAVFAPRRKTDFSGELTSTRYNAESPF